MTARSSNDKKMFFSASSDPAPINVLSRRDFLNVDTSDLGYVLRDSDFKPKRNIIPEQPKSGKNPDPKELSYQLSVMQQPIDFWQLYRPESPGNSPIYVAADNSLVRSNIGYDGKPTYEPPRPSYEVQRPSYPNEEEERRTPFPFKDPNPPTAAGSALPKPVRIGTRTTVNDRGGGSKKSSATGSVALKTLPRQPLRHPGPWAASAPPRA